MKTSRSAALALTLSALAAVSAASCKDDAAPVPTQLPRTGTHAAAAPDATAKPTRAATPVETPLPDAPPLTVDAARRTLLEAVEAAPDVMVVRDALLALAATGGADSVRPATAKLLAKGEGVGGYADPEAAAAALEALVVAGDAASGPAAVALAKAGIDAEDVFPGFVPMLAAVTGPSAAEARRLLVRLADDPILCTDAVIALAPLREPSAATRLHDVATDSEEHGGTRATAACGLLALGDARATAVLESLVAATKGESAELQTFEVIDGLAVAGVADALPWMRKIADPVIDEGENCALEVTSLAAGIAAVRGTPTPKGNGTPDDIALLRKLLGKDDGMCDDEVLVALWTLGDDAQADAAANVLAKYVAGATSAFDEELPVRLLGVVAARGRASGRPFGRVVDAAAAVALPSDPRHPDGAARAWRIRVAAARAHLSSKR